MNPSSSEHHEPAAQQPKTPHPHRLPRRTFTGAILAATGISLLGPEISASADTTRTMRAPVDFGSVASAPRLPDGFASTFKSRCVQANGIRQHVVIGGDGPPLLLVHGWPENWFAWRFVMPALARDYTVVAVDQRGIGLSEKTRDGYDTATLATDLAALMTKLGHQRFAVVGHDTGYIISYALAADHRDRVARVALAEVPGPPGVHDKEHPAPPLFLPDFLNDKLWHIPFNRVDNELIIDMVKSNADAYYRYEYAIQGGGYTLPDSAINYYVRLFTRDRNTLRASFGLYRAWEPTQTQNAERQKTKLTIPVLGIGGENSWGALAAENMRPAAHDVQGATISGAGHWLAEQAPKQLLTTLTKFLAPYHAAAVAHRPR